MVGAALNLVRGQPWIEILAAGEGTGKGGRQVSVDMLQRGAMKENTHSLADVASSKVAETNLAGTLPWVGMRNVQMPVQISLSVDVSKQLPAQPWTLPARVDALVSLDQATSRGIHMSRLYSLLQEKLVSSPLSWQSLCELSLACRDSQAGLSQCAFVAVQVEVPVQRPALRTEGAMGWRTYPVIFTVTALSDGSLARTLEVRILYSSTCPASAALSRQLLKAEFLQQMGSLQPQDFSPSSSSGSGLQAEWAPRLAQMGDWLETHSVATPHAQRSEARVRMRFHDSFDMQEIDVAMWISLLEDALQTPVQTLVKRADEQEFAKRNAANLMFCEDAARRVQSVLRASSAVADYVGEFQHWESLHPHDAISRISSSGLMSLGSVPLSRVAL